MVGELIAALDRDPPGSVVGIGCWHSISRPSKKTAREQVAALLADADRQVETMRKQAELAAKEEMLHRRALIDREAEETRRSLRDQEKRLDKRADLLDGKLEIINKKDREFEVIQRHLATQQDELTRRQAEARDLVAEQREVLHRLAQLGPDEAREILLRRVEGELSHEMGGLILKHELSLRETAAQKAREILATAIQRYAAAHTAETTVSTVDIPTDDMKGRIIGREGRNIRAFEKATGVDVIVDDTPGIVIVSAFDNIRRETAKIALEKLIQDGRIHPTRIDEIVAETQVEMERHIRQLGRSPRRRPTSPACTTSCSTTSAGSSSGPATRRTS